jgi:carboxymethylenebutenolidase
MPEVTISAADGGKFAAYLAKPASGKGPGILVCQEIFGINKVMRDVCDGLAAHGYLALCPDLFWRQKPGIQLDDHKEADMQKAFGLYQGFDETKGVADLKASLATLRALPGCSGKVGDIGYCLGGKLAYFMATRSDADCSVGYYGVGIDQALDEAKQIKKPLMLHIAEKDSYCPPEAQAKIKSVLAGNPHVVIHSYPGADHAFARVGGAHYDKAAAELANQRSADFLKKHLA